MLVQSGGQAWGSAKDREEAGEKIKKRGARKSGRIHRGRKAALWKGEGRVENTRISHEVSAVVENDRGFGKVKEPLRRSGEECKFSVRNIQGNKGIVLRKSSAVFALGSTNTPLSRLCSHALRLWGISKKATGVHQIAKKRQRTRLTGP